MPGLFQHLLDLIDPAVLAGKPVLQKATGGGVTSFDCHPKLAHEAEGGPFGAHFRADKLSTAFGGGIKAGNAKVAAFEPVILFAALAP